MHKQLVRAGLCLAILWSSQASAILVDAQAHPSATEPASVVGAQVMGNQQKGVVALPDQAMDFVTNSFVVRLGGGSDTDPTPVSEPTSAILLASGLLGLGIARRRRR